MGPASVVEVLTERCLPSTRRISRCRYLMPAGAQDVSPLPAQSSLPAPPVQVAHPVVHQPAPPLEQVRPRVGRLGLVAHHVRQRGLDHLPRVVRTLRGPIPEAGPGAVRPPQKQHNTIYSQHVMRVTDAPADRSGLRCAAKRPKRPVSMRQQADRTAAQPEPTPSRTLLRFVNERIHESRAEPPDSLQVPIRPRRVGIPGLGVEPFKQFAVVSRRSESRRAHPG